MNSDQLLGVLRQNPEFMQCVTHWHTDPARPARYAEWPDCVDKTLPPMLAQRGVRNLYTHQAAAIEASHRGEDIVVVTPTASGKTMCYNLPVLSAILQTPTPGHCTCFPPRRCPPIR